ncbi:MAG: helix-turn-helix transcriptional regulator [Alphaproteobacteria bacterium]|nr:helix-turn-helix transcriptional regulator [Alphaproteobacteria bacterium]
MALQVRKSKVALADERCPIGTCMELLGGAWTPQVIWSLAATPRRFSELQIDMKPISAKVLSTRLRELEAKGVVTRAVMPTSPPSVEYALTELGRELVPAIEAIAHVGFKLKRQAGR